jgi:hypothetical protein
MLRRTIHDPAQPALPLAREKSKFAPSPSMYR